MNKLDLQQQADENGAPNFRHVSPPCCYQCNNLVYKTVRGTGTFVCHLYDIDFKALAINYIGWQAEYICDSFEPFEFNEVITDE